MLTMNINTHLITANIYLVMLFISLAIIFATLDNENKRVASLKALMTRLFTTRTTRLAFIMFWWWVGIHFLFATIHHR